MRRWFWSGILGELYGGAIETRFVRDLEQVPAWAMDGDDPFGPLEQQRPPGRAGGSRGQAVIEENERGGGHSIGRSHPLKLASIAHMGVPQVNIEGFGL